MSSDPTDRSDWIEHRRDRIPEVDEKPVQREALQGVGFTNHDEDDVSDGDPLIDHERITDTNAEQGDGARNRQPYVRIIPSDQDVTPRQVIQGLTSLYTAGNGCWFY